MYQTILQIASKYKLKQGIPSCLPNMFFFLYRIRPQKSSLVVDMTGGENVSTKFSGSKFEWDNIKSFDWQTEFLLEAYDQL